MVVGSGPVPDKPTLRPCRPVLQGQRGAFGDK